MNPTTNQLVAEYVKAMQAPGVPGEPLQVYTSNSFRRIGLAREYRVICRAHKHNDGTLDITGTTTLEALVAAFNAIPSVLQMCEEQAEKIASLRRQLDAIKEVTAPGALYESVAVHNTAVQALIEGA